MVRNVKKERRELLHCNLLSSAQIARGKLVIEDHSVLRFLFGAYSGIPTFSSSGALCWNFSAISKVDASQVKIILIFLEAEMYIHIYIYTYYKNSLHNKR